METAKNTLYYEGSYYEAEEMYRHVNTADVYEVLSFLKTGKVDYVILNSDGFDHPFITPIAEFALLCRYYLEKVVKPKYKENERFTNLALGHDIKILGVSPEECSITNSYSYFVEVKKANDKPSYTVMSETFLNKLKGIPF